MNSLAPRTVPLTFRSVAEPVPGPGWQGLFSSAWPAYRRWYLRDGAAARTGLQTCRRMLATHMPELVPTWQRLAELAGDDELAAQMLTLYNPPPFMSGCSQAVHLAGEPALVRNYDYSPELFEGVVLGSSFTGRRVVGTSDCLWGLVDGMNDAGLAVSLAFGGRTATGPGFGIPLVLRYLLEVCDTAGQAREVLARLPVHMAYIVTVADRDGGYFTAFVGPASEPVFTASPVAVNFEPAPGDENVAAPGSRVRHDLLAALAGDGDLDLEQLVTRFLEPPLHSGAYALGSGTLYTAVYRPGDLAIEYRWPGSSWKHSIGSFASGRHEVLLGGD
ncbi:MAG TPA: C45 family peptidase [Streptosporangiaceae bacterium]|nr:C45 family peptidase [Streptosporangiaceae bacterium]